MDNGQCEVNPVLHGYPDRPTIAVQNMSRQRLRELFALADETCTWLEDKGLKLGEQCAFREIAERIWFTPK